MQAVNTKFSRRGVVLLKNYDESVKLRLTNWLIKQRELGTSCPIITGHTINEVNQLKGTKISERGGSYS